MRGPAITDMGWSVIVTESTGPLRDLWTTVNGHRIYSRAGGEQPHDDARPIVLIHGFGVSSRYLVPTAEHMSAHCPVYAPDFPGSGKSDGPHRALTLPELADFLARWMQVVGIRDATMLGNSFGCQIIAEFALRYPELISRAVLVGPTIDPSQRSMPPLILNLARDAFHERPSAIVLGIRDYLRFGFRRALATFRIMLADRIEDKLPAIAIPTLVVRGERDPLVSQQWVETVASLLPAGRLVVIPGAAHAVNHDAPLELVAVVRAFLDDSQTVR